MARSRSRRAISQGAALLVWAVVLGAALVPLRTLPKASELPPTGGPTKAARAGGDPRAGIPRRAQPGKPEMALQLGHRGAVRAAAFSADGRLIATGSDDATVRIWDARTGGLIRKLYPRHTLHVMRPAYESSSGAGSVQSLSFSTDGQFVAAGSMELGPRSSEMRAWPGQGAVRIYALGPRGKGGIVRHLPAPPEAIALSRDGSRIATAHAAGSFSSELTVSLWTDSATTCLWKVRSPGTAPAHIEFSPDGERVILTSLASWEAKRFEKRAWSTRRGRRGGDSEPFISAQGDVRQMPLLSPDLRLVAERGSTLEIWERERSAGGILQRGRSLWREEPSSGISFIDYTRPYPTYTAAAFSPDSTTLAVGTEDGSVRLRDARTGAVRWERLRSGALWAGRSRSPPTGARWPRRAAAPPARSASGT